MPTNRDRLKAVLLAGAVAVLGLWVMSRAWQLRPGSQRPPQVANPVICTACGHQTRRETLTLPQKCPKCGATALHLAGLCPRCQTWTAWAPEREKALFEQPGLWNAKGPAWFFPRCGKCGGPTNGTGEPFPPAPRRPGRPGAPPGR